MVSFVPVTKIFEGKSEDLEGESPTDFNRGLC